MIEIFFGILFLAMILILVLATAIVVKVLWKKLIEKEPAVEPETHLNW